MSLPEKLKTVKKKKPVSNEPLWKGPCSNDANGGITFSLLSKFLCCRERFRLNVIEGIRTVDQFNHRIQYGSMWHVCEEAHAKGQDWQVLLKNYCYELCRQYRMQQEQVHNWWNVCKTQFPIYVDYWAKHKDVKDRTPLLQEEVFNIPYVLPSRRIVRLRGKFDSVDLIGKGKAVGVYLQENKSKGEIVEQQLKRQLSFDMQTMMYLTALQVYADESLGEALNHAPIKGVRYNVIRRPLSGGKGSIRQHQPTKSNPSGESAEDFYRRLGGIIREEPETFFMRWLVTVSPSDIRKFRHDFLDPCLEQLCDWFSWMEYVSNSAKHDPFDKEAWISIKTPSGERCIDSSIHYRTPYGFFNALAESQGTDLDEYLISGSMTGLTRVDSLFGELC